MSFDWEPFAVSLRLGLWSTVLLLAVGLPLGWAFARSRSWWALGLEAAVSLPLVLAPTVLGFYLLVALSPQAGLGRLVFELTGIRLAFSFPGIVVAGVVSGLPLVLSTLRSAFAAVPPVLLEASATLGKGPVETFFRVVLPQARAGIAAAAVLAFAHALGEFGVVLMVGGSIPGVSKVVSIALYERVEALDFAGAQAYALILVAVSYPAMVLLLRLQRTRR